MTARDIIDTLAAMERREAELERECARLGTANDDLCDEVYRLEQLLRAHGIDPQMAVAKWVRARVERAEGDES